MDDYDVNISKGQCEITENTVYIVNYSPGFPDEAGKPPDWQQIPISGCHRYAINL